ncbi:ABC transporter ATP-binding protein, partial [Singulisphaera rosea]
TLLLADEPTGNLDSVAQREVLDLLSGLRHERKLTMLVVTHSAEVADWADRILKLRDGKIVSDG